MKHSVASSWFSSLRCMCTCWLILVRKEICWHSGFYVYFLHFLMKYAQTSLWTLLSCWGAHRLTQSYGGFDKAVWSLNPGISKGQMTVLGFHSLYTNLVPPSKYLYKYCCQKFRNLGLAFVCFYYV